MSMTAAPAARPDAEPMMDMNMTPLIDVMLVLIIMLIITIPRQNHAFEMGFPAKGKVSATPQVSSLDIDFDGTISWDGKALRDRVALNAMLAKFAASKVPKELHLRSDKHAAYKVMAGVLAAANRAGVKEIAILGNEQL